MSWETSSISFSEATTITTGESLNKNDVIREENEQKRLLQLQNFRRDEKDEDKAVYQTVMLQFGKLLTANNKEEIIQTILADDCEIFLFNFADSTPAQYGFQHEGFLKLFQNKRVIKREVKETYVSLNKATGFQICECEVVDETKGSSMSQFSVEVFSFSGNKLIKYRTSYGYMSTSYNPSGLFLPTKKELTLAKVKELNYAWADQPDLGKIASLLPDSVEYKIYRWKDKKCFTFDKHNIVSDFKKCLEEDFVITCVVPYGISCEAQYIFGSYIYHLEGKNALSGQKFIWVSTCIYSFDQDCNIKKMSQQGDLYPDGNKQIPFQVRPQEKLIETFFGPPKVESNAEPKEGLSIFATSEAVNFSCDLLLFGSQYSTFAGHIKGLSQFHILEEVMASKDQTREKGKVIDIFEDLDDPYYDSVIITESNKGTMNTERCPFRGKLINFHSIMKFSFENRKLAKCFVFSCPIPDPIPSPFDDTNFIELNFRPKSEFLS